MIFVEIIYNFAGSKTYLSMSCNVYLSLGSNSGDRMAFLEAAVRRIALLGAVRVSAPYHNEPDGFESSAPFINLAAVLTLEERVTEDGATALLRRIKTIERELSSMPHRNPDGSYHDREIDIDIVAVDGLAMETPELTLPHPRAAQRDFVVTPLRMLGIDTDALLCRPDNAERQHRS